MPGLPIDLGLYRGIGQVPASVVDHFRHGCPNSYRLVASICANPLNQRSPGRQIVL